MKTTYASSDPNKNAKMVQLAPGLAVESPVQVVVEDCNGYDVDLVVVGLPGDAQRAGRLVCRELTVRQREGGPAVTGEALRSVPVATLTNLAVSKVLQLAEGAARSQKPPEGVAAHGPTDEALRWVAHLYRLALVTQEKPTKAVEEALQLPRSTAGRWVSLARERGFLGASEGSGKAGG